MIKVRAACAVLAATLVVSICSSAVSWATVTPTPVMTGRLNQDFPGANLDWFAWDMNSKKKPHHYNVYAEPRPGGTPAKVNPKGTYAYHPDMQLGSNWVVYQQVNHTQTRSTIYTYNAASGSDHAFRIAGAAWKYWPVASSRYLVWMEIA